jgi:hypothetical protein
MRPGADFMVGEAEPNIILLWQEKERRHSGRPLTNIADAIIELLVSEHGFRDIDKYRIIYEDTEGEWDGMATKDGKFSGFVAMSARNKSEATEVARIRPEWIPVVPALNHLFMDDERGGHDR